MSDSLREAIMAVDDRPREPAPTPEWPDVDGQVYVQPLSASERLQVGGRIKEGDDRDVSDELAFLVVKGAVTSDGSPVFKESDASWLPNKNGAVVHRLTRRIQELSGMTAEAEEDAVKNSEETLPSDLPTS